jgi:hypothetical protein
MKSFKPAAGAFQIILACVIMLFLAAGAYSADRRIKAKVPGIT